MTENNDGEGATISSLDSFSIIEILDFVFTISLVIYAFLRGIKQILFRKKNFLSFLAIGAVMSVCATKIATQIFIIGQMLGIFDNRVKHRELSNMFFLPNFGFLLFLVPLFWQMIITQYGTRLRINNSGLGQKNVPPLSKIGLILFWILYGFTFISFGSYALVFNFGSMNVYDYLSYMASMNVTYSIFIIVVHSVYFCRLMSGIPYISQEMKKNDRHMQSLLLFATLTRLAYGAIGLWLVQNKLEFFENPEKLQQMNDFLQIMVPVVVFMVSVICDILPMFFSLNIVVIKIFQQDFSQESLLGSSSIQGSVIRIPDNNQQQYKQIKSQDVLSQQTKSSGGYRDTYGVNGFRSGNTSGFSTDTENTQKIQFDQQQGLDTQQKNFYQRLKQIQMNDLEYIIDTEDSIIQKHNGIGEYKQCYVRSWNDDQNLMICKIQNQFLTNYMMEEIQQDFKSLNALQIKQLVKPLKLYRDKQCIYIITLYFENLSLRNFLGTDDNSSQEQNSQNPTGEKSFMINSNLKQIKLTQEEKNKLKQSKVSTLTLDTKVNISISICQTMCELHQQDIIHGHLHMENILMDDQFNTVIADLGFRSLKKLQSLRNQYMNIGYYTAPEFLDKQKNKYNYIQNPTKAQDVYSFGYVLYEIFFQKRPLHNLPLQEIRRIVVEQQKRPKKIQEALVPDKIEMLIDNCWLADHTSRPSFEQILGQLELLSQELSNTMVK